MAHSIELLLDDHSDAAIRQLWAALDDAGLPSQLRVKSATNRPHITMLAAERIAPDVDAALAALGPRFPLDITIGAPLIFTGARLTLARLGVASEQLLDLHREVYQRSLQHVAGEPYRHSAPGHWTPHVTLGRRLTPEHIGIAIQVVEPLCADISARIAGLRRWDGDQRVEHQLIG